MLQFIPTIALVLLNLIVIFYVFRVRDRTRSGFFLVVNAMSLILWSGGFELWRSLNYEPFILALPGLAAMLIPANFLYFAGSRPMVLSPTWESPWLAIFIFLPPVASALLWDYNNTSILRRSHPYIYPNWTEMWASEGGWPLILTVLFLIFTIILLVIRHTKAPSGPDRNLPRHLLLAVGGLFLFALLFSFTTSHRRITMIFSPSLVMALMAQIGIFVVIRQEEVQRPLYLSRWIYYSIIVLVGFLASHVIYTMYESLTAQVLLAPTVRFTILATITVVLIGGSLPPVQALFDRLMFSRAWEYRQLVREAQDELYETRERLRQAERLSVVGEMAARIAHEIKNPLGPIKGYTQMMREKLDQMEDFPQRATFLRHLSIISEEVETIDSKVRHLLDLARKPDLTTKPEDINKIVERAAILLRLEAETVVQGQNRTGPALTIHEDLDSKLPIVFCNRPRIEEALSNICRNAFEAVGGKGTITLKTRRTKNSEGIDGVEILVIDDGPGLSDSAKERLFEPFFTEKKGGTGLGLSIVKSHMDLHKGTVNFEPAERRGTRVALWMPVRQDKLQQANDKTNE